MIHLYSSTSSGKPLIGGWTKLPNQGSMFAPRPSLSGARPTEMTKVEGRTTLMQAKSGKPLANPSSSEIQHTPTIGRWTPGLVEKGATSNRRKMPEKWLPVKWSSICHPACQGLHHVTPPPPPRNVRLHVATMPHRDSTTNTSTPSGGKISCNCQYMPIQLWEWRNRTSLQLPWYKLT